jgi:hypothetical protein
MALLSHILASHNISFATLEREYGSTEPFLVPTLGECTLDMRPKKRSF